MPNVCVVHQKKSESNQAGIIHFKKSVHKIKAVGKYLYQIILFKLIIDIVHITAVLVLKIRFFFFLNCNGGGAMWMQNWLEVLAYMKINIRNQNRFPIISTAFAKANSTSNVVCCRHSNEIKF